MFKSEKREKKRRKKRHGMQVRGRSVLTLAEQKGTTKKNTRKGRKARR